MITTKELALINFYADKNNPKFELNGIFLDKENKNIVATNTRALIVYHDEDLEAGGIIKKETVELGVKSCPPSHRRTVFFLSRKGAFCGWNDTELVDIQSLSEDVRDKRPPFCVSTAPLNGKYPEYQRILVNKETAAIHKTSHSELLRRDIYSTGVVLNEKWIIPFIEYVTKEELDVHIYFNEPNLPIMFTAGNFTLVVMPIVLDK